MSIPLQQAAFLAVACFPLLTTVRAAPSLSFPVNSQVPPAVRVSQPFDFTFAKSTFIASDGSISYSLEHEPSWLQFNSESRTFYGNATAEEAGPVTFGLIASDSSGSTSSEVTFVVTDQQGGPKLGNALLPQLTNAGRTSAPASLFLYPFEAFSIIFTPDTFSDTTMGTKFYATSADNSPLPSWLQFDPTKLSFSGTSPPLLSPTARPQEYGVRLIASNIPGFAEAVATFQIVVGYKTLAFSETSQDIHLSQGEAFESGPLRKELTIDGKIIDNAELASVTSNASNWIELDTEQIVLSGIIPQDATSQTILIQATDIYGNTANTVVNLVVSSSSSKKLFNNHLPPVNVTIGQDFHYTIEGSALASTEVQVTADLSNAPSWLAYDTSSRTFSGSVPDNLQPVTILITLDATLDSVSDSEEFTINVIKRALSKRPSDTVPGLPTFTVHVTPEATPISEKASQDKTRTLVIVLAVVLPVLFLFFLGCIVLYCCWRRRQPQERLGHVTEKNISRPIIRDEPGQLDGAVSHQCSQAEKTRTPTSPPRIELPWAPDSLRKPRQRLSKSMTHRESTLVDSGWGDLVIREPSLPATTSGGIARDNAGGSGDWAPVIHNSHSNLNYSRKRTPLRSTQGKVLKPSLSTRASKTLSGLSTISVGLPARLSGAGHGAGGPEPPGYRDMHPSWTNKFDSIASEDGRTTPFDLNAFPEPPKVQAETTKEPGQLTTKPSVRLVPSSSSHSGSLVDRRGRWIRERARERYERGPRFSHGSSKGRLHAIGLDSAIRSPSTAKSGSLGPDDLLSRQNTWRSWSQSSSIGAPVRPETMSPMRSPDSRLPRRPSNLRRVLSTLSSGRFDSAESKSNSSWIDDLIEEQDEEGRRRWVAVDRPSQEIASVTSPALGIGGGPEQSSWGRNSRTGGLGALRANIQGAGPAAAIGERRWRLRGQQAKRPISVDEGELQRSQASQKGNLAFV